MTLGIDVGGTNLNLGLVHEGRIQRLVTAPSFRPEATMEQTLEYLASQIRRIITPETTKIGIGVPTIVDIEKGIVYEAVNIPSWKEVPIKEYLENEFHIPVAVNNDANCYAMGVYGSYPADRKPELLVTVTLGTGVGIGIVAGGQLFCGVNCGAGELGSLPYKDSIIEDYCAKKFFIGNGWEGKKASEAAAIGDPAALALYAELGENLGEMLCAVMLAYDPSHIALGGGIAKGHAYFHDAMMNHIRTHFPYKKAVERLQVDYFSDNDIPVIGAALL